MCVDLRHYYPRLIFKDNERLKDEISRKNKIIDYFLAENVNLRKDPVKQCEQYIDFIKTYQKMIHDIGIIETRGRTGSDSYVKALINIHKIVEFDMDLKPDVDKVINND